MTNAYPLHWPPGMPRNKSPARSQFKTTLGGAVGNVQDSLRRFAADTGKKVESLIISSNVTLTSMRPTDSGVAVYFRWDAIDCCIAVDRYGAVEDNLQAIHHIIEAERTKLRHGGLNIVRASFRGYANLPPPTGPDGQLAPPWRAVLGVTERATIEDVESAYRALVKTAHPDRGGDPGKFNLITDAVRQARQEFGA